MRHSLEENDFDGSGDVEENDTSSRVRLGDYDCGKQRCHKGNIYVEKKPVCHGRWDDNDAKVVCRELGFHRGGVATSDSFFGRTHFRKQIWTVDYHCSGSESSLFDCSHYDREIDCGDWEGAGVICHTNQEYSGSGDPDYHATSPTPAALLSSAGDLVMPDNTNYKAGEFCMAEVFQGEDEWNKVMGEGEALAVMCEPCKSEVGNYHQPSNQFFCRFSALFYSLTSLPLFLTMRLNQMKGIQEIEGND